MHNMKVLKFGGTSVANATNIKLVLEIIQNQAKQQQLTVVVSALSNVTDLLQTAASKAAAADETYKTLVIEIEKSI